MLWPRAPFRWALGASALLHVGLVVALSEVEPSWATPRAAAAYTVDVVPTSAGEAPGEAPLRRASEPPPVAAGGPQLAGTLDRDEPEGRGGERTAEEQGALLFPFSSPLTLQDTELNNLALSQVQRIRTARERATLEQRRATPHPADAVLLASGAGGHAERRAPSAVDAARGAPAGALPSIASSATEAESVGGPSALPRAPARKREAARAQPSVGVSRGRGRRESQSARVVHARPNVDPGPAATPAQQVDPRVRDDVDAELLAATLQRSFIDSSVQRAAEVGPGSGGPVLAPGALGHAGSGTGARARPYLPGSGRFGALDTSDARYLRWFTQQRARVQNALKFPRERALAKDQGTSLYSVVLGRDGALTGEPRLVRSSGFDDFDRAAAAAIRRALPFAPLPKELAPDLPRIALLIPVAFSNPMIE